ncbi:UNVERIFIED_CONTAM: Pentatricopeptide repeat-containing protein [Sesamum angustifolium]|uniref:Pentatricopeptide repeat-containing protein n=1 Tax=Sesamum angustifolium TaxID=2727405 RepID=A0AAW2N6E9_9LAMI
MASLAARRQTHLNANLKNLSSPLSIKSLSFCSSAPSKPSSNEEPSVGANQNADSSSTKTTAASASASATFRSEGKRQKNPEKIEDIICRMMANRAWTTRLQNSIRNLVPSFDHELVYNVLHGAKKSEHALQFFRWVERSSLFQHNRETHQKIIEILGRATKLNHARCILLDMPKKGLEWDEDLWVLMIDSYGQAGIVQESVKLFRKMEELGVQRSIKSYDALFKVILRRGRYMMAKRYFNKMLSESIEPTRHTFNIMIWGFFLSGKVETANRFFEDMKSREITPDVVTYNTLINGYYRVKKMEAAEKYFVEMKGRNIEPTVVTYTTLIKGYVSVDRVDDALRLMEEMKGFGIKPNAITYSTLLPGLCDAEKMSEAQTILREMVEKYVAPKDNSIFMRLISGQCKVGNLDAAADVLKAMIRLSVPTEAGHYGVLIENCCKAGEYDRAVKLLDKLIEKDIILRPQSTLHMESSAYNPLIEYLCKNGQSAKAETLLRQLMKLGVQDPIALNTLICGRSQEGNPDSAFELLKIMLRRNVRSRKSAYDSLVKSYLRKSDPADAKAALDSMIENGHLPDSSLYRSVMESLFEDGRSGIAPDFDGLLSVLCEKGKTIAALKLLDYGLERDYKIDISSYEKVLDALLAAGKTLNAYSILLKIMEKGGVTDWSSCKDLIKSLNEEGNTKQADILSRMIMGKDKQVDSKKGNKRTAAAC